MAKKKISFSANALVNAIIYAVIGLLLLILKGGSLSILMTAVGALLIVMGIMDIVKSKEMLKGVIELVCGIAVIVIGWLVVGIVLLVFGIVLAIKSALEVYKNYKNGFMSNLSSIVALVIGILLIFARGTLINTICVIAGIAFLIDAVLMFVGKK